MSSHADAGSYHSMLEDPANRDLVRWGREGDTFLVLNVGSDLDQAERKIKSLARRHQIHPPRVVLTTALLLAD
jgi:hypothetical protein